MPQTNSPNSPLAVLIDADNASASIVEGLLAEVAKLGIASVKRIYGDWTGPSLGGWKAVLLEHSIQPVQQFRYTTGKNATDSAMIIDAMDLLYTGRFEGFCIVSSDSDFTRLASRIRESGLSVYGFGEKKTPRPFVTACDQFTYTEIFSKQDPDEPTAEPVPRSRNELRGDTTLMNLLRSAIEAGSDDSNWAPLSAVGLHVRKMATDFDPRNHGFSRLSDLIAAIGLFDLERRETHFYVRDSRKDRDNG